MLSTVLQHAEVGKVHLHIKCPCHTRRIAFCEYIHLYTWQLQRSSLQPLVPTQVLIAAVTSVLCIETREHCNARLGICAKAWQLLNIVCSTGLQPLQVRGSPLEPCCTRMLCCLCNQVCTYNRRETCLTCKTKIQHHHEDSHFLCRSC